MADVAGVRAAIDLRLEESVDTTFGGPVTFNDGAVLCPSLEIGFVHRLPAELDRM
jgi:hypothetical protein